MANLIYFSKEGIFFLFHSVFPFLFKMILESRVVIGGFRCRERGFSWKDFEKNFILIIFIEWLIDNG